MMEKVNNTGKIVGALLVGAAVGAALGILFAPNKGAETRKKLMAKSDDLSDAIKEKFNDFMEDTRNEVEHVKVKANNILDHKNA